MRLLVLLAGLSFVGCGEYDATPEPVAAGVVVAPKDHHDWSDEECRDHCTDACDDFCEELCDADDWSCVAWCEDECDDYCSDACDDDDDE